MLDNVYLDDPPQINNETVLDDVDIKNVKFSREEQKHEFCTLDQDLSIGSKRNAAVKTLYRKHCIVT